MALVGALAVYGVNATAVLTCHVIWLCVPLVIGTIAFLIERRHLGEPLPGIAGDAVPAADVESQ